MLILTKRIILEETVTNNNSKSYSTVKNNCFPMKTSYWNVQMKLKVSFILYYILRSNMVLAQSPSGSWLLYCTYCMCRSLLHTSLSVLLLEVPYEFTLFEHWIDIQWKMSLMTRSQIHISCASVSALPELDISHDKRNGAWKNMKFIILVYMIIWPLYDVKFTVNSDRRRKKPPGGTNLFPLLLCYYLSVCCMSYTDCTETYWLLSFATCNMGNLI